MARIERQGIGEPGALARPQEDALALPHRNDENEASVVIWPAITGVALRAGPLATR